jgi:hypothetical protein
MEIKTISDFRRAIRNGPYVWPGGYPIYFLCADGGVLSFKAAKAERRSIIEAIARDNAKDWRIVAMDVNWEDPHLHCEHTGERIESAYAEPEGTP